MVDEVEGERVAIECKQAAPDVATDLKRSAVAASRVVRLAWPGLSSAAIADALGNRVTAGAVRQWRAGIRPIPQWVREEIRAQFNAALEALEQTKAGPGMKAGWNNLGAYRAARNNER